MIVGERSIACRTRHGRLIQAVHKDKSGCVRRVSNYHIKAGQQCPVSETIYYDDGSSALHMYNERGEVWQTSRYDKDGQELPPLLEIQRKP